MHCYHNIYVYYVPKVCDIGLLINYYLVVNEMNFCMTFLLQGHKIERIMTTSNARAKHIFAYFAYMFMCLSNTIVYKSICKRHWS